jgi:hypothetical protein
VAWATAGSGSGACGDASGKGVAWSGAPTGVAYLVG